MLMEDGSALPPEKAAPVKQENGSTLAHVSY